MYIKHLKLENFKSFHDHKFEFNKGFTVIAGPNGTGKSNIYDAILFAIGNTSSKALRYKNISDLIYKGLTAEYGRVELILDNDAKIERYVTESGSVFKFNNKRTTLEAINNYLKQFKISVNGHNIVLQDDIKKFVEMDKFERKKVIEEIAGLDVFDEHKDKTLKNLQGVEDKIKQTRIILEERKQWLDKLKDEKEVAENYLSLQVDVFLLQALILKTEKLILERDWNGMKNKIEKLSKSVEENKNILDKLTESLSKDEMNLKNEFNKKDLAEKEFYEKINKEQLNLYKYDDFVNDIKNIENELSNYDSELNSNNFKLGNFKDEKSELNRKLELKKKELINLENEIKKYSNSKADEKAKGNKDKFDTLMSKLKEIDIEISDLKDKKNKLENEINSIATIKQNLIIKKNKSIELDKEQKVLKQSITSIGKELENYTNEKNSLEIKRDSISDKIETVKFEKNDLKEKTRNIENEIDLLKNYSAEKEFMYFVKDNKEISKIVSEKEKLNEFGTFVFIFNDKKQVLDKDIVLKKILPDKKQKALEKEIKINLDKISNLDKEAGRFDSQFSDIRSSLNELYSILVQEERKYSNLKTQLEIKTNELNNLNEDLVTSKVENKNYDKEILVLENKISSIMENKEKYLEEIEKLQEFNSSFDKYNELVENKHYINTEILKLQNKIEIIDNNNNLYSKQIIEINKKTNVLKSKLELKNKELKVLNKRKEDFEILKEKEQQKLEKVKSELSAFEVRLSSLRNKKNDLRGEIIKEETELENIKFNVNVKEHSVSEKELEIKSFVESNKEKLINFEDTKKYDGRKITELREMFSEKNHAYSTFGRVNLKAIEDFEDLNTRYNEILEKTEQLQDEREMLLEKLEGIEQKKEEIFFKYYEKIRKNFDEITTDFGMKNIILNMTSKKLDAAGVEMVFKKGARIRTLNALSGGEKSLATIALLLAIMQYEPASFYLLDEVDAALDYKNTAKVADYLRKLSEKSQIILISHNQVTIDKADYLIGISKNRLGITSIAVKQ
jgi:chromosome segregation protein